MVVGQDRKYLGALVVPAVNEFKQAGYQVQSVEDIALNPDAQKIIREEIKRMTSPGNGFKSFEQIRDFRLLKESFQVGHELTNLFKIKRHVVTQKFGHVIEEIYANETKK